ncbi:type II toxin-antitoxin system Phd/YefM family antitoxin [Nonomuraea africana]|uniref:type II toxin-antitoxin system Phd/YefM family antitoxin n=1 Tax=Nonomuraea africana TaxID=46171 RepID=UPI0031E1EFCC
MPLEKRGACVHHCQRGSQSPALSYRRGQQHRTAVEIVSKSGNAYLVAAEEYEALQETAHLLRSPANARRLIRSYHEALEGRQEKHDRGARHR